MENFYEKKYLAYKLKYIALKLQTSSASRTGTYNLIGGADDQNKTILYLFKSDRCGHCISFAPIWEELKKTNKFKIDFKTFDSDVDRKQMEIYKIDGFPTLKLISNDKIIEFEGQRTQETIEHFIESYVSK